MSTFEKKYLKYKTKYLTLKSQININSFKQTGGSKSIYDANILNLTNLSVTPSMMEIYGYEFKGGSNNNVNYKALVNLLDKPSLIGGDEDSSAVTTTESLAATTESAPTESSAATTESAPTESSAATTESAPTESAPTESAPTEPTPTETPTADTPTADTPTADTPTETPTADTPTESPIDATGGGKSKKGANNKYFFEESDLNTTLTSDSDLSLNSDSD
jgi:hypothetical protein